jgi:hypothetical protein
MRQYLRILARHKIFYSTQINTQQTSLLSLSAYQLIKAPSDPAVSRSTPTLQQHHGSALAVRSTPATASSLTTIQQPRQHTNTQILSSKPPSSVLSIQINTQQPRAVRQHHSNSTASRSTQYPISQQPRAVLQRSDAPQQHQQHPPTQQRQRHPAPNYPAASAAPSTQQPSSALSARTSAPKDSAAQAAYKSNSLAQYPSNPAALAAPKHPASPKAISSNKSTPLHKYQIDLCESIHNLDTVCYLPRRSATPKSSQ